MGIKRLRQALNKNVPFKIAPLKKVLNGYLLTGQINYATTILSFDSAESLINIEYLDYLW